MIRFACVLPRLHRCILFRPAKWQMLRTLCQQQKQANSNGTSARPFSEMSARTSLKSMHKPQKGQLAGTKPRPKGKPAEAARVDIRNGTSQSRTGSCKKRHAPRQPSPQSTHTHTHVPVMTSTSPAPRGGYRCTKNSSGLKLRICETAMSRHRNLIYDLK